MPDDLVARLEREIIQRLIRMLAVHGVHPAGVRAVVHLAQPVAAQCLGRQNRADIAVVRAGLLKPCLIQCLFQKVLHCRPRAERIRLRFDPRHIVLVLVSLVLVQKVSDQPERDLHRMQRVFHIGPRSGENVSDLPGVRRVLDILLRLCHHLANLFERRVGQKRGIFLLCRVNDRVIDLGKRNRPCRLLLLRENLIERALLFFKRVLRSLFVLVLQIAELLPDGLELDIGLPACIGDLAQRFDLAQNVLQRRVVELLRIVHVIKPVRIAACEPRVSCQRIIRLLACHLVVARGARRVIEPAAI